MSTKPKSNGVAASLFPPLRLGADPRLVHEPAAPDPEVKAWAVGEYQARIADKAERNKG